MEKKRKIKVRSIITTIFLIVFLIWSWNYYQTNNFNEYVKAEYNLKNSKFSRDASVKYGNGRSYKIESEEYNDAMFYKTIDVTPNTSYKVTCKIKTENVEPQDKNADVGAHICIAKTFEKSDNVLGTTDWTEVTFYFNSKNRQQVDLGFRLGGAEGQAKGTAWFSDFKIEAGMADTSNEWNFLCLLFDYVNVNVENKNLNLQLTATDKDDMTVCLRRFKSSMEEMSEGKMKVNYDIAEITTPITHFSHDDENGYYVSGYDIKDVLDPYIATGKYDHVFIAFRTGDINRQGTIPVNDWIGLGSMEYRGLGFSNIRLPDDDKNYIYKYDSRINTFPEEVFIHEFLHTLERNAEEYGYERPELHSYTNYGYANKPIVGLKQWYEDYMNKGITKSSGEKIGLPQEIFDKKPSKISDFENSTKLDYLDEPNNIFEELKILIDRLISSIKGQ